MEVAVVLLKCWTSDSKLAGVLLREVRRANFVSAIPCIGFACLSKSTNDIHTS